MKIAALHQQIFKAKGREVCQQRSDMPRVCRGRNTTTLPLQCYTYLFELLNTAPLSCELVTVSLFSELSLLSVQFSFRLHEVEGMKGREQKPTGSVCRWTNTACHIELYTLIYTYVHTVHAQWLWDQRESSRRPCWCTLKFHPPSGH